VFWVPIGNGHRGFILPLQELIASRPNRARDHVDVLPRVDVLTRYCPGKLR
jgi:hypothetical protein